LRPAPVSCGTRPDGPNWSVDWVRIPAVRGDADEAYRWVAARRGTIAAALLDQGRIAGMGNVFRAEVLHGMLMPPTRLASLVSVEEFAELWERLQPMMRQAVDDGRIITVEAEDRLAVPEAESRRVYKQELCYDCGTPILTGRSMRGRRTPVPGADRRGRAERRCRRSLRTRISRSRCGHWT
jgi:Formamidopyrimidine-DNA glycosylase H2TH domain